MPRKRADPSALTQSECYAQMAIDHQTFYQRNAQGQLTAYSTDDGEQVSWLARLDRFVAMTEAVDEAIWEKVTTEGLKPILRALAPGVDASRLRRFIQLADDSSVQRNLHFSEPFQIFVQARNAARHPEETASLDQRTQPRKKNITKEKEEDLIHLLKTLRSRIFERTYRRRLSHRKEAATNNFKRGKKLFEELFEAKSALAVARLELGHLNKPCFDISSAKADVKRFFNNLRSASSRSSLSELLGYVWKLEFTPSRGYYLHLVLIFEAISVRNPAPRVAEIGELWRHLTLGRGYAFDCSLSPNAFHQVGIGVLKRDDRSARDEFLKYGIEYLTMKDQFLKPYAPKTKLFDASQFRSVNTKLKKQERGQAT